MTTKTRRQREKEQRRTDILNAAKTLFLEHGLKRTTMKQIADYTELASGTIYLYFSSKKELYAEILLEGYDILYDFLKKNTSPKKTYEKQIESLIEAFFKYANTYPEYFDIIFFLTQSEGQSLNNFFKNDKASHKLEEKRERCKELMKKVLANLEKYKEKDCLEDTVEALWTMLAGVVYFYKYHPPHRFQAVALKATEVIVKGVMP